VLPVELDSNGLGSLDKSWKIHTDCGALNGLNAPIQSAVENVKFESAIVIKLGRFIRGLICAGKHSVSAAHTAAAGPPLGVGLMRRDKEGLARFKRAISIEACAFKLVPQQPCSRLNLEIENSQRM